MKQVELQKVGKFTKTHGINGYLVLSLDDNISIDLLSETIAEQKWIFVDRKGIAVPFCTEENDLKEFGNHQLLIKIDEMDTNAAKNLCSSDVFVNAAYIENDIRTESVDYNNITDFIINDENMGTIGKVEYLLNIKENPLAAVNFKNKEILIPLQSEYILDISFEQKEITSSFPDNYLEMLG